MYEYINPLIVLCVWYWNPTLLLKTEAFVRRTITNLAFSAIECYSDHKHYNNKNEMVKDGYHVNVVFLEIDDGYRIRKFDVTSVFRSEILKGTFDDDGLPLIDFVKKCSRPNNNIRYDVNSQIRLQIDYTFDRKSYVVTFDDAIVFPIYLESELRQYLMRPTILSAVISKNEFDADNGIYVTDELNKFAGPLGNFYDDKPNITVRKDDALPELPSNYCVILMDSKGKTHVFKPENEYLTLIH